MIEKQPESPSDIVDCAMSELRSSPVPPGPPPELLNVLLQAAKESTGAVQCIVEASAQAEIIRPTFLTRSLGNWRPIMRHPVFRATAATIFVLAIAGVALWFHAGGATPALADFIQPILDAKSVKYKMTATMEGQSLGTNEVMLRLPYRKREEIRRERPGGVETRLVVTWDFQKAKSLCLNPERKTALVTTYTDMPKDRASLTEFAALRSLLLNARDRPGVKREPLGEKEIDGHKAVGYRLSGLFDPDMVMSLWGDPKTGLPVRVEEDTRRSGKKMHVTMSDFVFNVDLDESLFSVEPPDGYAIRNLRIDASPTEEKDLIETLREYSQRGEGKFPDVLDVRAAFGYGTKSTVEGKNGSTNGRKPNEGNIKEANKNVEDVAVDESTRGLRFVLALSPDADAHYAGKGVKFGAADTPIFWYHAKDSKKYRVIYADFSVREAAAPPDVPNAQPVPGTAKPKK